MTTTKLWRVDTEKGASLVKAADVPEALENAIAGRCYWGPIPKRGWFEHFRDEQVGDDYPTFDNVIRVEEVSAKNTTEGL